MNTTAQVKQAIKKSAQQMAQEPLELLRTAAKQVTGEAAPSPDGRQKTEDFKPQNSDEVPQDETKYKQQVAEQDGRHLQALESELKDIRRQKLFNELMRRIQEGENVPLVEFSELSFEQKDVLKAQAEATKNQRLNTQNSNELAMPASKKGRKMGGGQKGAAKKEETRVEKPVPPSG